MSQGPSREAALANLEAVLSGCLAVRAECGMLPSVEIDPVVLVGREVVLLEVDGEDS
jgi:predicted RNase H-like HicB family nuclease